MHKQLKLAVPRQPDGLSLFLQKQVVRINWSSIAAFVLPLLLYWRTMAPTIYNLDSAEFTTAVATNGLIRATGYPLYLLLGKIWSWLPVGDMGYRMNLFSAVCGAGTLLLVDRILQRLRVGAVARVGALGLLGTAVYFWAMSLIAEVYTLHTVLMAGILLALLRWAEKPALKRLALPIFLAALSLGNHAATVLLIPGCIWFVLVHHPRELTRGRVWATTFLALLVGLAVFLIIPFRYSTNPVFNYAGQYDATGTFIPVNLQTWDGFWWLISGQSFTGQMFGYQLFEIWPQVQFFGSHLWRSFLGVGIGPGLLGIWLLLRRNWRLGSTLLLIFLINAVFYINYRVVDKATMFLPTFLIWSLWVGVGFQFLIQEVKTLGPKPITTYLIQGAVGVAVLSAILINRPLVDLSGDWSTRTESEAILEAVKPDALIFGWWETVPAIQYLQLVEGQRPDVTAVNRFLISGEDMNRLILSELGRRPIYINNPSIELLQVAYATPVGTLYLLQPYETGTPRP